MFTGLCGGNGVVVLAATLHLRACIPGVSGEAAAFSAVVCLVVTPMLPLWSAPVPAAVGVAGGGDEDNGEAYTWTAGLLA